MIRRTFLRRMMGAALASGLLGSELLARRDWGEAAVVPPSLEGSVTVTVEASRVPGGLGLDTGDIVQLDGDGWIVDGERRARVVSVEYGDEDRWCHQRATIVFGPVEAEPARVAWVPETDFVTQPTGDFRALGG